MPWELFYGAGALVLVGALVYGVVQSGRRNRANDPVTDKATKELYRDQDAYDEDEFRSKTNDGRGAR